MSEETLCPAQPGSDDNAAREERYRLAALERLQIMDTTPEPGFDRLTEMAALWFRMDLSFVSFVDENRQWFKSCFGMNMAERARHTGFCHHAIAQDEVFVVPDTWSDAQFLDNPAVTEMNIRFYAGAPLITAGGHRVGTLCLLDRRPRMFDAADGKMLEMMAAIVVDEMELRLARLTAAADRAGRAQLAAYLGAEMTLLQDTVTKLDREQLDDDARSHLQALRDTGNRVMRSVSQMVAADAPAADTLAASCHVLLVEDNRVNHELLKAVMEERGYRVTSAFDGREGVERAAEQRFDLIFMDCHMPVMDGFAATAHIRTHTQMPNCGTPIIAVTASNEHDDRARCIAAGMNDYLEKPVEEDAMAQVVHQWTRRQENGAPGGT